MKNYNFSLCPNICCVLIHPAATWVGGGYILGIAEMVYTPSMGLTLAATMLAAYSLSFILCKFNFIIGIHTANMKNVK